ncbi:MAG: hypothetical protein WCO23_01995 [bacterium]
MRKSIQKFIAVALTLASVLSYYTPAKAAIMTQAKVYLSDPRASIAGVGGDVGSTYTYTMTTSTEATIKGIKIVFANAATGGAMPTTQDLSAAAIHPGSISNLDGVEADWSLDKTAAAQGVLYLVNATSTVAVPDGTVISFGIDGIVNPTVGASPAGCVPDGANASSGTCYTRVKSFDTATIATMAAETPVNIMDFVTIAYTVSAAVTVTATVDPSLTFWVTGVAAGGAEQANGHNVSATTDYQTLPFGYIQPSIPKYLAHNLRVRTNSRNGYDVKIKMVDQMTGKYPVNVIDPYIADKDNAITWGTPANWASPNGDTANVNTGWIGANTNDTDVAGYANSAGKWGPVFSNAEDLVMTNSGPDKGRVPQDVVRVSYAIEVNEYQPSDSYTGTLYYNCTPTY